MIPITKKQCTVGQEVFILDCDEDGGDLPWVQAIIATPINKQGIVEIQRIQFDFGKVEKIKYDQLYVIPKEVLESELEAEFKEVYDMYWEELDKKVRELAKVEREAIALSEKCGLPFRMGRSYMPRKFYEDFYERAKTPEEAKKFEEFVDELTNANGAQVGWQNSQTC